MTSVLKNVEKLVEQTASLKVMLECTGKVNFCTICEISFLLGGP